MHWKTRLGPVLAAALLVAVLHGCASGPPPVSQGSPKPYKVSGKWYQPLAHSNDFRERGIASWYGQKFHGRKTASGEVYNMYDLTAAHKTLPLGTKVKVLNRSNNRTVVVKVNDRGPFVRGRIIDLSYAAAKKINMVGSGTAPVEIMAVGGTGGRVDYYTGNFTLQVGAFKDPDNARRLKNRLDRSFKNAHIVKADTVNGLFYRVRVGRCSTLKEARRYEAILNDRGFPQVFIVAE